MWTENVKRKKLFRPEKAPHNQSVMKLQRYKAKQIRKWHLPIQIDWFLSRLACERRTLRAARTEG